MIELTKILCWSYPIRKATYIMILVIFLLGSRLFISSSQMFYKKIATLEIEFDGDFMDIS